MAIPFFTTQITNTRSADSANVLIDPYDGPPDYDPSPQVTVNSGVRAVVSTPSLSNQLSGGNKVVWNAQMRCDVVDMATDDVVTDRTTGLVWQCLNVEMQQAFGLNFLVVSLRRTVGQS